MKKIYSVLLGVLSVAVLLSGCSSQSTSASKPTPSSKNTKPAVTATAVPKDEKTAISATKFVSILNSCGFNFDEDGGYEVFSEPSEEGIIAIYDCPMYDDRDGDGAVEEIVYAGHMSFSNVENANRYKNMCLSSGLEEDGYAIVSKTSGDNYTRVECNVKYGVLKIPYTSFLCFVEDTYVLVEAPTEYRSDALAVLNVLGY